MARILIAWEIGEGLGHAVPVSQIAKRLLQEGHRVDIALGDLSTVAAAFGALVEHPRLSVWQAPIWRLALLGAPEPASYAELLFQEGFLDPERIFPLVCGWHSLFEAIRPDLLLLEHAPTALLASKAWPVRTASFGPGFFIPPRTKPLPSFREWDRVPADRLLAAERRALETCNAILARLNAPPFQEFADLLRTDACWLLTWPELDHFAELRQRSEVEYFGALPAPAAPCPPFWPKGKGPRIFLYLKARYTALDEVVSGVIRSGCRVCAYVPGITEEQVHRYAHPAIHLCLERVDMERSCIEADAIVCNAGAGSVAAALESGKPLLLLPMNAEQVLTCRRVLKLRAGICMLEQEVGRIDAALAKLIGDASLRTAAEAFASLHRGKRGARVLDRLAASIEDHLRRGTQTTSTN